MRVGSLASGGGGLDLAVAALWPDAELAWVAETDPHASTVLAARFPDAPNLGDVRSIDDTAPPVDVLVGGLPCQPYSTAGQRRGATDERDLLPEAVRLARDLGPRLVLLENVASLVRAPEWRALLGALADVGYDVRWTVVRASDLGACHRRARLFAVAHPHSDEVRLEPVADVGCGDEAVAVGAGPQRLLPTPNAADGSGGKLHKRGTIGPTGRKDDGTKGGHGDGGPDLRTAIDLLPTPQSTIGRNSTAPPRLGAFDAGRDTLHDVAHAARFGDYQPAIDRHAQLLERPAPEPVDNKGRLAPKFVEWMMCWPDGWVTDLDLPRTAMLRILGNGVVPAQAVAGYRMLEAS